MARSIARGMLSFSLVAIPIEIHTATKSQNVFSIGYTANAVARPQPDILSGLQGNRLAC